MQTGSSGSYHYVVTATLSGLSISGTPDAALLALEGQGTLTVTFQFNDFNTLDEIEADASDEAQLYAVTGAINSPQTGAMVPDIATTLALLGGTGTALGLLLRKIGS